MNLIDFTSASFSVDADRRTMRGVVVPWGEVGNHTNGDRWRFGRGSLRYGHAKFVKFNNDHDSMQGLGRAIDAEDTDEGLVMTFKVNQGPDGDRVLNLAKSGRKTGLSVEVEIDPADMENDPDNAATALVSLANLTAVGFVKDPAFNSSRLISVVASKEGKESGMPDEITETAPAQPVTFSADQFNQLMSRLGPQVGTDGPEVIDPTGSTSRVEVSEPLPYRFSHEGGRTVFRVAEHDFSTDIMAVIKNQREGRDYSAPLARANGLIAAAFADIERADVTALNPNRHRSDLWQPQMDFATPLWDLVNSGSTDGTKFDIPKFTSASGLVGPATEKVEPAGGSLVVELQTITPTQVWGKAEITRQSWRDGGSPQMSGILWDQMLREYYEDREAAVATFLGTLTAATDVAITAGAGTNASDLISANDLEAAIAALQFVRGGNRFRAFAAHIDLYKMLARVTDTAGRKLYPQINPMNANGTAESLFATLNVAGTRVVPSWALGATGTASANSWLFDPAKVRGWADAPERLFWDFGATVQTANVPQLSFVTVGIYGNVAFGNTDINGVRQVTYDPVA